MQHCWPVGSMIGQQFYLNQLVKPLKKGDDTNINIITIE